MRFLVPLLVTALVSLTACGGGGGDQPGEAEETTIGGSDTSVMGGTPMPAAPATAANGQAIYSANCATCHGPEGRGDGPAAVGLEPPPANLTDGTWVTGDGSLPAIENIVANGSPGTAMIGWKGTLSDAEIQAVASYVQSLSR